MNVLSSILPPGRGPRLRATQQQTGEASGAAGISAAENQYVCLGSLVMQQQRVCLTNWAVVH
jgi:hypothetical protein